jgi:hypothetical protein
VPPPHVLFWLALGGSIALASVAYLSFLWLRERGRALDDATFVDAAIETSLVPIADARDGDWVRIVGTIVEPAAPGAGAGRMLEAPLAASACVAYSTVVELVHREAATPFARESLAIDFLLDDGTGRAHVAVAGARIVLSLRSISPLPQRLARFHERSGWTPDGRWRCREGALAAGATVAVVGQARWEPDPAPDAPRPDASYRGSAEPRRLRLATGDLGRVVVTDDPRAIGG